MKIKINTKDMMHLIEETLNANQQTIFRVQGFSMEPFFKDDLTSVTLEKKNTYQLNDVVLFKYQGAYKLHRIVRIKKEVMICKGDYLFSKEITDLKNVIGYVVSYETNGKTVFVNQLMYRFKVVLWRLFKPVLVRIYRVKMVNKV